MQRASTVLFATAVAISSTALRAEETERDYLFVQIANVGHFRDGVLTLGGIGPMTVYFSDRPERQTGSLTHAEFIDAWTDAADSFASDPPHASLVFRGGNRRFVSVMELSDPALIDGGIRYRVKLLKGDLPAEIGPASLFIDSGGLMQLVAYGAQDVYLTGQ